LAALPAGDEFVDFLRRLRATGMRPFELRTVEARHLQDGALIFDIVESKGKKVRRSVPLNDTALAILQPLAEKRPTGKLFRNHRGNAWTKFAAVALFQKYRDLAGLGKHITMYAIRHEFISAAIETGEVDPLSLSKIVGHRDLTMISRIYSHLGAKSDHFQKMVRKAIGEKA